LAPVPANRPDDRTGQPSWAVIAATISGRLSGNEPERLVPTVEDIARRSSITLCRERTPHAYSEKPASPAPTSGTAFCTATA
jgi:hypothetical protein